MLRNNLAVVHYCRGRLRQGARRGALQPASSASSSATAPARATTPTVIGIVYLELGLYDLARGHLEDALAIHRETGSRWSEADTLVYLGLLEAGHAALPRRAAAASTAPGRSRSQIGAKYIAVNARNAIAWTLCERNGARRRDPRRDEATEAAETARAARLIVGEIPGLSRSARATALLGNLDAARALSRRAVRSCSRSSGSSSPPRRRSTTRTSGSSRRCRTPPGGDHLEQAHNGLMGKLAAGSQRSTGETPSRDGAAELGACSRTTCELKTAPDQGAGARAVSPEAGATGRGEGPASGAGAPGRRGRRPAPPDPRSCPWSIPHWSNWNVGEAVADDHPSTSARGWRRRGRPAARVRSSTALAIIRIAVSMDCGLGPG